MEQTIEFTIAVRDFDLHLLPKDAREPGTERFGQAVAAHFEQQFAPMGGQAVVVVDDEQIGVSWRAGEAAQDPMAHALSLLQAGRLADAVPLLRMLLAARTGPRLSTSG